MATSVLLVHSPLVGPSSWTPAAGVLRERGFVVAVPDLTAAAQASSARWRRIIDTAAGGGAELPGTVVVVGHSGAGAFLPAIGQRLAGRLGLLVFIDAVVPPSEGAHEASAAMKELLDEQTVDGRLRRWLKWWPDEVINGLLPNASDRASLLEDMPRLSRSFYDEVVPVPDGWSRHGCAYLKLSEAYEAEFEQAAARGWPCMELEANHLSIYTEPARVVAALESILDRRIPRSTDTSVEDQRPNDWASGTRDARLDSE